MDQHLELVFLTGVSKFSKTGIFSGLNNLTDLTHGSTVSPRMLGYTQEELTSIVSVKILTEAALQHGAVAGWHCWRRLRIWYNGYRFQHRGREGV
jgi:hypothetical protein